MRVIIFLINFILEIVAFKQPNYHDSFKLKSSSPQFYVNVDKFNKIKYNKIKLSKNGRSAAYFGIYCLDELLKHLPDCSKEINDFKNSKNELDNLLAKQNFVSDRINFIKNNSDQNEYNYDKFKNVIDESVLNFVLDLKLPDLLDYAINLRKLIRTKNSNYAALRENLKNLYYKLPFKKLYNIPQQNPLTLNVYKSKFDSEFDQIPSKYLPYITSIDRNLLTHDKILEIFNYPWQKSPSRMLTTLGGTLSLLENALVQYLMWVNVYLFGFIPVSVPYFTEKSVLYGTGHLPKFQNDLFSVKSKKDNLYLIPTGEVPLVEMLSKQCFDKSQLPIKLVTYTQCFRDEQVGYGKESKSLLRQHQFGKVELLVLTDRKSSSYWHSLLVSQVEFIMRSLNLGYLTELLPVDDTPMSSAMTVDIKGFFPATKEYIELSSISNTLDHQSKFLNITVNDKGGNCHVLNASALPIGRLLSCFLETHQIHIPNSNIGIKIPQSLYNVTNIGKILSNNNMEYFS